MADIIQYMHELSFPSCFTQKCSNFTILLRIKHTSRNLQSTPSSMLFHAISKSIVLDQCYKFHLLHCLFMVYVIPRGTCFHVQDLSKWSNTLIHNNSSMTRKMNLFHLNFVMLNGVNIYHFNVFVEPFNCQRQQFT